MNKVILIGRLVRDPELRYTQSQRAVCTFTLAVDKRLSREKKNEMEAQNRPTADFLRITVWGIPGENASKYLRKGSQCAVDGRIETGSYQDRETGKTVYTTDVVADNVEFIGSRSDNQSSSFNNNSYDNQDTYRNDYSQTNNYQQNRGNNNNNQAFDGGDDFFDDDFTEIEDDGRIPF
ncbi:single-stranded DNA-binding protein [Anaerococcus marasmi]|uniref:single-stranded DNA-binding protein n=1 Tax=Anaerococcus marasmi TaxID=2057797 RepID=UPI000CFA5B85|nr:single-stranded DNA-binding protein [Anaerococcus marasmi]